MNDLLKFGGNSSTESEPPLLRYLAIRYSSEPVLHCCCKFVQGVDTCAQAIIKSDLVNFNRPQMPSADTRQVPDLGR
jgi:hypothetical protein